MANFSGILGLLSIRGCKILLFTLLCSLPREQRFCTLIKKLSSFSPPSCSVWLTVSRHVFSHDFQNQSIPGQETKAESDPFPSGFRWKLVIKSGTTPKGSTGEEPSWVYKRLHMRWHTYLCCVKVTCSYPITL